MDATIATNTIAEKIKEFLADHASQIRQTRTYGAMACLVLGRNLTSSKREPATTTVQHVRAPGSVAPRIRVRNGFIGIAQLIKNAPSTTWRAPMAAAPRQTPLQPYTRL